MYLSARLVAVASLCSIAFSHPAHLSYKDETSALALVSGYTEDSCDGLPFGDYVVDFEVQDQCVGNGTIAHAVSVQKLAPGCVVNAYTFADCTGEIYPLSQVGCWIEFTYDDEDLGVQGLSVSCNASASATASMAAATASPSSKS